MKIVFTFLCILGLTFGLAIKNQNTSKHLPDEKASYNYAVDLVGPASVSTFSCLKNNYYYSVAFIRVYLPTNGGQVDNQGCAAVINAAQAGLGTEIYVTPSPLSAKQGYQQFDEAYSAMQNSGITVRSIWLQVTSPINWSSSQQSNIQFITSFLQRALQYGVTPGIYTNSYDWQQVTSSWTGWQSIANVRLWYWNVLGQGASGETSPDFSDFRSFGGWSVPSVKQFGQFENICGLTVNRDVYPAGTKKSSVMTKAESIVVGELFQE